MRCREQPLNSLRKKGEKKNYQIQKLEMKGVLMRLTAHDWHNTTTRKSKEKEKIQDILTENKLSTKGQSMEPSTVNGVIIVGNTPCGNDMATRWNKHQLFSRKIDNFIGQYDFFLYRGMTSCHRNIFDEQTTSQMMLILLSPNAIIFLFQSKRILP